MHFDEAGLPLTTDDPEAPALFDATVNAYLAFRTDTGHRIKALLTQAPEMPMANVLMGYFYLLMGSRALVPRAEKSLAAASASEDRLPARERNHIAALRAWRQDDFAGAVVQWEAILLDYPRDILAAKLAHFGHFYLGDSRNIRDSVARILPAWSASDGAYGFLLSMHAFGLEETGDYGAAEAKAEEAVALNRDDIWGVHARAHVLEMQDRHAEGIDWLNELEPAWSQANNFRYHVAWHRALFYIDRGEPERALELYDETIWDPESNEYLDLCNDVALLARLDLAGVDTRDRWAALGAVLEQHTQQRIFNFIDAHYALGLAHTNEEAAAAMVAELESTLAERNEGEDTHADVARHVGLELVRSMICYGQKDYAGAVDHLLPVRYRVDRIGGSHAQRDLFAQLLIDAAIQSNQTALAKALVAERKAQKPNNPLTLQLFDRLHA